MKKIVLLSIVLSLFIVSGITAQEPGDLIWSNSYGGMVKECGYSMTKTTDGGYIMGGYTNSFGAGDYDVYLVKVDATGDTLWTKAYGGTDVDKGSSIQQCLDGGYILAGETKSFGAGGYDFYLIKTDANGDTLWTNTFGGTGTDKARSISETSDGGFIVTGETRSFGAGGKDVYLIRTDANGDSLWTKTFGAVDSEEGNSVKQTIDGGYVIAGFTESFGAGGRDAYLIKTNADGDTLWTNTFGGTNDDRSYCVQQCDDGGYAISGDTKSSGAGLSDFYLIKTDANGQTVWSNTYGGISIDIGYALQQTPDGGYIIAGSTQSFDVALFDIYLVRTDAVGDTVWTGTYGSFDYEHGRSVELTSDGNYVVAGWTFSYGPGTSAFWLLKIAGLGDLFFPPENLFVDAGTGLATWESPVARDLIGYNVYLDDVFIEFTTDLFWQYTDLDVGITYMAGVSTVYDDPGESEIIEYEFSYIPIFNPPENLDLDETTGLATWETPLERDLLGYNVYLDGTFTNFTTDLFWQYTDLVAGTTYLSGVSAAYDDGVSVIIEYEFIYNPPTFDPPDNVFVDPDLGLLTWEAPEGQLFELIQHNGVPADGYFQSFDYGYGVVYDLTGYTDVTLEMLDFRHSSWETYGIWDYALHIVDWDTQTEIAVVTDLQTTGDDIWEENISLGSVSETSLVGVFMEPMGYFATDAYPCIDCDGGGPDGLSFYGPLANYSAMSLSTIGDFLMDLWILAEETDEIFKAKKFEANFGIAASRTGSAIPNLDFITLNQTSSSRDLIGYNVYLDDMGTVLASVGFDVFEYQYTGLINGQSYIAGVSAVYDEEESEIVEIPFTYSGTSAGNIVVATTMLDNNYPNPFNPITTIAYSIIEAGYVTLQVYNVKGQLIKTLVSDVRETGNFSITWNGTDNSSKPVSSGIYFYKMKTGNYEQSKKMILLK